MMHHATPLAISVSFLPPRQTAPALDATDSCLPHTGLELAMFRLSLSSPGEHQHRQELGS
jgi:hypothetical protein